MPFRSISIVIPTYNRALILLESLNNYLNILKSVDSSLYEIIIVDNSVNDETENVINSFKPSSLNLKYFRNIVNIGGGPNILRGFEYSQNEFIWILPDDCYPSETFLNSFISFADSNIDLFFVGHINDLNFPICIQENFITSSFISESSWLPKIIYKRELALNHLAGAYNFINYSYPHLYIIYNIVDKIPSNSCIQILNKSFATIDIDKNKFQSYSWIKGSAIKFAEAINKIVPNNKVKKSIIKSHKIQSNLNLEVFKLIFWEFNFLKISDFLTLIKYYGFFHLISFMQFFIFLLLGHRYRIKLFYLLRKSSSKNIENFYKFYREYLYRINNSRAIF